MTRREHILTLLGRLAVILFILFIQRLLWNVASPQRERVAILPAIPKHAPRRPVRPLSLARKVTSSPPRISLFAYRRLPSGEPADMPYLR